MEYQETLVAGVVATLFTTNMQPKIILRKDRGNKLFLSLNINGKRLSYYTGVSVKEAGHFKEGKVTRKDPLYKEKNARLGELLSKVTLILLQKKDAKEVADEINHVLGRKEASKGNLSDKVLEFSLLKRGRTRGLYEGTARKIKAFGRDFPPNNIDIKWLSDFEAFCMKTMSVNGMSIHLRNIRAVMNYLIDKGELDVYPFRRYRIKSERTVHRALDREELKALVHKDCAGRRYVDFFLLSFYLLGINPKDLLFLRKEDMSDGRIRYRRHKTGRWFDIKVEPEALHLINIYRGKEYLLCFMEGRKDYLSFVKQSDKALKKIKEGLTLYWARHTWATIAYKAGVRKDIISRSLGHSSGAKVTDIYIDYDTEDVDNANRKVLDYIK